MNRSKTYTLQSGKELRIVTQDHPVKLIIKTLRSSTQIHGDMPPLLFGAPLNVEKEYIIPPFNSIAIYARKDTAAEVFDAEATKIYVEDSDIARQCREMHECVSFSLAYSNVVLYLRLIRARRLEARQTDTFGPRVYIFSTTFFISNIPS